MSTDGQASRKQIDTLVGRRSAGTTYASYREILLARLVLSLADVRLKERASRRARRTVPTT